MLQYSRRDLIREYPIRQGQPAGERTLHNPHLKDSQDGDIITERVG